MANQPLINKFTKGVNTDIAEELLPNTYLSNGHNIKLTNDDNKQGIVQKQESYIKELDGYGANLKPLAAKSFNNVIYIISCNTDTGVIEYGTYPSAEIPASKDPADLPPPNEDGKVLVNKLYKYAPLPNYKTIPKIIADPAFFYNIAGLNADPEISTLHSITGSDWELVDTDDGINASPAGGGDNTDINITIEDNYTQTPQTKIIQVKPEDGPEITEITIYQRLDPWLKFIPTEGNVPVTGTIDYYPVDIECSSLTWEITQVDSGLFIFDDQSSGNSGDTIGVAVGDNTSTSPRILKIHAQTVEDSGLGTGIFQVHQAGIIDATGNFSLAGLSGQHDDVVAVNVENYTGGSTGNAWTISKVSGTANATFTPLTGTGNTTESVQLTGAYGESAVYQLVDDGSAYQLDTITITMTAELGTVVINSIDTPDYNDINTHSEVTDGGGDTSGSRGICWNTTGIPDIGDEVLSSGSGQGTYTLNIPNLIAGTQYYMRAYFTNAIGTSYSSEETRTTKTAALATVVTQSPSFVTADSMASGGYISDFGGVPVIERGLCYNTAGTPTIFDAKVIDATSTGTDIHGTLSGLPNSTIHYIRAYVTNSVGTGYGNEVNAETLDGSVQATGSITPDTITGITGTIDNVTIVYAPGDHGPTCFWEKSTTGSGNNLASATFNTTGPYNSTTGLSVAVTITGNIDDTATYVLRNTENNNGLDTLFITISAI